MLVNTHVHKCIVRTQRWTNGRMMDGRRMDGWMDGMMDGMMDARMDA
jgi:hypothetical protein